MGDTEDTAVQQKHWQGQEQGSMAEKRTLHSHQDTIFSSLYSDPECVLDLYFTLHPEDSDRGITADQLKLITLKNVFLAQRHNDIAFMVGDRLIVLVEHQSTINENMPLRMLFYVANEYEKIITSIKKKLYRKKRIKIPCPEFYIVYTGETAWNHKALRLSEAYGMASSEDAPLEVRVRILQEKEMQTTENTLGSYYHFVRFVKQNIHNGRISVEAVKNYVHQFAGSKLFKKFLAKLNAEEVAKMTNYEFDLDEAREVWQEEAREEGLEEGIKKGIKEGIKEGREGGICALVEICQEFGKSLIDTIETVARKFNLDEAESRQKVEKYWKQ